MDTEEQTKEEKASKIIEILGNIAACSECGIELDKYYLTDDLICEKCIDKVELKEIEEMMEVCLQHPDTIYDEPDFMLEEWEDG